MKMIATVAGVVLAMSLGLTQLSGSAVHATNQPEATTANTCAACFADTNAAGICDNRCDTNFVDADGDGICDSRCATTFVDADGDGICDKRCATNFVDTDDDGICDNRSSQYTCRNGANRGHSGSHCGRGKHCR